MKNGERKSHEDFLKLLRKLQGAGKRIYLITAGHDYVDCPVEYDGDAVKVVEGTRREELPELYRDFGFSEALAYDERTLSYVAEIKDGVRVLMLNCDGSGGRNEGTIDEKQLEWIREQALKAKEDDCTLFALTHYPILPAVPIFEFIDDTKMHNNRKIAEFLADCGIGLVFTGHMHLQSVKHFVSEKGNGLYDVCTSSLVGCPARYRKVILCDGEARIESLPVPNFDWDKNGLRADEYIDRQFENMIENTIDSILSGGSGAVGVVKRLAKFFVDRARLGTVGRLLFVRTDKLTRDIPLKAFIVQTVKNVFTGDAPYKRGSSVYEFVDKALFRLRFVLTKARARLSKDGEAVDLRKIILDSIGNNSGISDNNATLSLEGNCKTDRKRGARLTTVK